MKNIVPILVMIGFVSACAHNAGGPSKLTELERINESLKQSQRANNVYDHINHGAVLMY